MTGLGRRLARAEARSWRCPACGSRCPCGSGGGDGRATTVAAADAELERLAEELRTRATKTAWAVPREEGER